MPGCLEFFSYIQVGHNQEIAMSESKVVIRINVDKEQRAKTEAEPKTVTVWHVPRILAAITVLLVFFATLGYFLIGNNQPDTTELVQKGVEEKPQANNQSTETNTPVNRVVDINQAKPVQHSDESIKADLKQTQVVRNGSNGLSAVIFDKRVLRASLNSLIKYNEPYEAVNSQVNLTKNQTIELFYFNEIKGINDRDLYHYWSKDGKTVYKKQLPVKEFKAKLISSKKMSFHDKGSWKIQLVDGKGKVFCEVNFIVESE